MDKKEQKGKIYESRKVYDYLSQIAQTPLLTEDEEKEILSRFQEAKDDITTIFSQFPQEVIDKLKDMQDSDGPGPKKQNERWWDSLSILDITDQVEKENGSIAPKQCEQLKGAVKNLVKIRNQIINKNLLLVADIAKKLHSKKSSLSFLDLMHEGSIGLMRAIDKFDLQKGYKFSTYAYWWIQQAIKREWNKKDKTVHIPSYIVHRQRKISKAIIKLKNKLDREPYLKDIAEELSLTVEEVKDALIKKGYIFSLDEPANDGETDTDTEGRTWLEDLIEEERQNYPDIRLDDIINREYGEELLEYLSEQERTVLLWRCGFMNGKVNTLAYIANKLDISRERVRQLETQALRRLRMVFIHL